MLKSRLPGLELGLGEAVGEGETAGVGAGVAAGAGVELLIMAISTMLALSS